MVSYRRIALPQRLLMTTVDLSRPIGMEEQLQSATKAYPEVVASMMVEQQLMVSAF